MSIKILALALWALSAPAMAKRADSDHLTEHEAQSRSKLIQDANYHIYVDLKQQEQTDSYQGVVDIHFQLLSVPPELTLDFRKGTVKSTIVNETPAHLAYNRAFLTIPGSLLKKGSNHLHISFSQTYSKDGSGFYRFRDPQDRQVYLYTDFEPYDASRFAPLFDQPDLRSTFQLTADVPSHWQVITSVREKRITDLKSGHRRWEFPRSARFSSYVFSLHAGPFHVWQSQSEEIPLRLFVRQSMKTFVPHDFWLRITQQGLAYFHDYFSVPYPFHKYDQVIVPDFNSGAMENVAAVTFSERYLRKGTLTRKERERIANVVMHEMAHMWFGNLVTMRWWDDLWLNESFATYMASLALAEATEFKESWLSFTGTKEWAYWEDGLITKHPIATPVPNTDQAFANFDGITYGKGASVLKQLSFLLGPEAFKNGVRRYITKHAWSNTELEDFLTALDTKPNHQLNAFSKEWLQTAGTNTVHAKFSCRHGKIDRFLLHQTSASDDLLHRTHKTIIALLQVNANQRLQLESSLNVTYRGSHTLVKEAVGKPCPDMVFPNYQDHDFVHARLDEVSLATAFQSLSQIEDTLLRAQVWNSLWNMVRKSRMSVYKFSELAQIHLIKEPNLLILRTMTRHMFGTHANDRNSMLYYLPHSSDSERKKRQALVETWEQIAWNRTEAAAGGSDEQKLWFDAYTNIAQSTQARSRLLALLNGKIKFDKFEIDQNRRWRLILRLSAFADTAVSKLIESEKKRDPSSDGRIQALAAEASRPDIAVKELWFREISTPTNNLSLEERRAVMGHIFPPHQSELQKRFIKRFFTSVTSLAKHNHEVVLNTFVKQLAPTFCSTVSLEEFDRFFAQSLKSLPAYAQKELNIARQEDYRCLAIRRYAGK